MNSYGGPRLLVFSECTFQRRYRVTYSLLLLHLTAQGALQRRRTPVVASRGCHPLQDTGESHTIVFSVGFCHQDHPSQADRLYCS